MYIITFKHCFQEIDSFDEFLHLLDKTDPEHSVVFYGHFKKYRYANVCPDS